jgi:hypothetical protein
MTPRQEARSQGQKTYLSAKPCSHGHSAPRLVCNGKCTECSFPSQGKHREYNARWKAKYPGRDQEVKYRHRYGVELSEIRAALAGEGWAMQQIADRLDGKPAQESTVTIDDKRDATDWTRDELVAFLSDAAAGRKGTAEAEGRGGKPDRVH